MANKLDKLAGINDKELKAELERRQKEANALPEPLASPNFDNVLRLAKETVQEHAKGRDDDDRAHWCFEAVLEAVYGKGIWDWWNTLA
jgi:hypothetical protein